VIDYPGEHPDPPADLAARDPLISDLPVGTQFSRIHEHVRGALFFGRTGHNRFDSPDRKYGVLYAGLDEHCAFIETFGQATGENLISQVALEARHLASIELVRPLKFMDLSTSGGLARIGADSRLFSGSHLIAQRWSTALRAHPSKPDGLIYPARHDSARNACAIFDCPVSTFKVTGKGSLTESQHSVLLGDILDCYRFGLIP
jgi:hypothetical protein